MYQNNPKDYNNYNNGKLIGTYRGITPALMINAIKSRIISPRPVNPETIKSLTIEEVERIYYEIFWIPNKCERMPVVLAGIHFNTTIHHGAINANKVLQTCLNRYNYTLDIDGNIENKTISALSVSLQSIGEHQICLEYLDIVREKYSSSILFSTDWAKNIQSIKDWVNRQFN